MMVDLCCCGCQERRLPQGIHARNLAAIEGYFQLRFPHESDRAMQAALEATLLDSRTPEMLDAC